MNPLSFITANYVAREVGYHMRGGWGQGETAANAFFSPAETYAERFDAMLAGIRALGFRSVDLWIAHLNPKWASAKHVAAAREALARHGLAVTSFAAHFGNDVEELRAACALARELGCTILSGGHGLLKTDRTLLTAVLREYGVRLAVENHPEKNPGELLDRMGAGDEDVIGAAVDTGWFGTQGYDAAKAVSELKGRIFHLHLKDVKARRKEKTGYGLIDMGHETCRLGAGIVPVEQCYRTAIRDGFTGPVYLEHEPEEYDPSDDLRASLELVKGWSK